MTTYRWKIYLFAGLAERLGSRLLETSFAEERLTAGELKRRLAAAHPEQADLIAVSFVARNQAFSQDEAELGHDDELALLPPVSGGCGPVEGDRSAATSAAPYAISAAALSTDDVLSLVHHPDHGAALLFAGTTRGLTGDQRTVTLDYEAYEPMALAALRQIGDEIGERWPGTLCAIHHRIGSVGIGETSVLIAVSSPHRAAAYEASRYAIERLKQTVPIWKREVYEDGSEWKGHQTGPWNPLAPPAGEGP
ncbi:molybdenum cofactor biosynthesis protein [Cohnella hashimotonis]|uniref:Molybdenum cofactor biosynthesis protein MoaE n=1 Tax=Cohnella hashimotonis TaxID=2826895 RepID=A0ABT6TD83_9BACL|nr:molybdenum cofactor biosynthesis protein MoaE [Cohnella hashimotonis]MDI4644793.1 molybdenum cofactor biosynthesis protein MoaE [Cohnella hashimotonis]